MKCVFETPDDGHYFFGYYDKSPLNFDSSRLLACKSRFMDRLPEENDILEIGYFDWKRNNNFVKLTETKAWNWQQGCMLQWFGSDYGSKIIFNDRIDNKFQSVILDISTNKKTILPMAYYTLDLTGKFLLCIDNERHSWFRRGYSYAGIKNMDKNIPFLEDDGIWKVDINTKQIKQIISLKQLVNYKPLSNMKGALHYVEHLMLNSSNTRFAFLHRWKIVDGGIFARLYTVNIDGSDLYLLNDSGRMSHFCWRNNNTILGWGGISNPINNLRKYGNMVKYVIKPLMPLYKFLSSGNSVDGNTRLSSMVSGDSYILFTDQSKETQRVSPNLLKKDGHPSFAKGNNILMITDTYPDINDNFKQELILYNFIDDNLKVIDKLNHDPNFAQSASRCDLHPKWSYDGNYISVDTLNKGYRSIYLYENH